MGLREKRRMIIQRNKENNYFNVRINGQGIYMVEGQFVWWKFRFFLDKMLENFREEFEDIDDRMMIDYEIQRVQWKNWGSWKEVRIGERLVDIQVQR